MAPVPSVLQLSSRVIVIVEIESGEWRMGRVKVTFENWKIGWF